MKFRVALNGFGEAGQMLLHHIYSSQLSQHFEVVAINELEPSFACLHELRFNPKLQTSRAYQISCTNQQIRINNHATRYFSVLNESKLPWKELDVDLVVESSDSSNQFATCQQHLDYGAKQVLNASNAYPSNRMWVNGVNGETFTAKNSAIEQASGLTQAIAPIIASITKNFEVEHCHIEHLQKSNSNQPWLDQNQMEIFTRSTGADLSLPKNLLELAELKAIFPTLASALSGRAVQCGFKSHSLVLLNFDLVKSVSYSDVISVLEKACQFEYRSVIGLQPNKLLTDKLNNQLKASYISLERTSVLRKQIRLPVVFDNDDISASRLFEFAASLRIFSKETSQAV